MQRLKQEEADRRANELKEAARFAKGNYEAANHARTRQMYHAATAQNNLIQEG